MYKITFRLTSKCVFIHRPMFDGLIAACYQKKHFPNQPQRLTIPDSEMIDFSGMPIKQRDDYFLVSWMFFKERSEEVQYKRKKWDDKHDHIAGFGGKRKRIDVQRGRYKSYQLPRVANYFESTDDLEYSPFGHVWFYFESDDLDEAINLIDDHLIGIGKDVHRGRGAYSEYVIKQIDKPFIAEEMRPVPCRSQNIKDQRLELMTYKPPYWDVSKATYCIVPRNLQNADIS